MCVCVLMLQAILVHALCVCVCLCVCVRMCCLGWAAPHEFLTSNRQGAVFQRLPVWMFLVSVPSALLGVLCLLRLAFFRCQVLD